MRVAFFRIVIDTVAINTATIIAPIESICVNPRKEARMLKKTIKDAEPSLIAFVASALRERRFDLIAMFLLMNAKINDTVPAVNAVTRAIVGDSIVVGEKNLRY